MHTKNNLILSCNLHEHCNISWEKYLTITCNCHSAFNNILSLLLSKLLLTYTYIFLTVTGSCLLSLTNIISIPLLSLQKYSSFSVQYTGTSLDCQSISKCLISANGHQRLFLPKVLLKILRDTSFKT